MKNAENLDAKELLEVPNKYTECFTLKNTCCNVLLTSGC